MSPNFFNSIAATASATTARKTMIAAPIKARIVRKTLSTVIPVTGTGFSAKNCDICFDDSMINIIR